MCCAEFKFSVDGDLDPDVRVICRDFIRGVCGRRVVSFVLKNAFLLK